MAPAGFPLAPGSTIGILGGGQLGRMMALAAARLGFDAVILDPDADGPAARVAACVDYGGLRRRARAGGAGLGLRRGHLRVRECPGPGGRGAGGARRAEVAPNARSLAVAQDRVDEKTFINGLGVATVAFAAIDAAADLPAALERLGAPALLKTRREGYDGKGQAWVDAAPMRRPRPSRRSAASRPSSKPRRTSSASCR